MCTVYYYQNTKMPPFNVSAIQLYTCTVNHTPYLLTNGVDISPTDLVRPSHI